MAPPRNISVFDTQELPYNNYLETIPLELSLFRPIIETSIYTNDGFTGNTVRLDMGRENGAIFSHSSRFGIC